MHQMKHGCNPQINYIEVHQACLSGKSSFGLM